MPEDKPIPLLDLTRYDEALKSDIAKAVDEVFASGRFVLGPANEAFEKAFAAMLGVRHALGGRANVPSRFRPPGKSSRSRFLRS